MQPAQRKSRRLTIAPFGLLLTVAGFSLGGLILANSPSDDLQRTKQERTMADIRLAATATMAWLTDQASAAAAGGLTWELPDEAPRSLPSYSTAEYDHEKIRAVLEGAYLAALPKYDGWDHPYSYRLNLTDPLSRHLVAIISLGSDGEPNHRDFIYSAGRFAATDYEQDLVWADGFFIRWPEER